MFYTRCLYTFLGSSSGVTNVVFLLGVVWYYAFQWGININIWDASLPIYTPLALPTVYCLTGILAMGFFLHNAVITIVKDNKVQKNNVSKLLTSKPSYHFTQYSLSFF